MPTLEDLVKCVDELNREFPRPGLRVEVSNSYDLRTDWPRPWPNSELPGVYAMLDENQAVLYLGKASCARSIGARLGAWFRYGPVREALAKDERLHDVRYVRTIGVPRPQGFEAPSIEEFLVLRLNPPLNLMGLGALEDRSSV